MNWKRFAIAGLIGVSTLVLSAWLAGTLLTAPVPKTIGSLPEDLQGRTIEFPSASGSSIHGWFLPGQAGRGLVILMHGVRASRLDMLARARFLGRSGFSVLLFDFQAHGESPGRQITFGYLESKDAQAAVGFARTVAPREKIGVIGVSMGGAAALLADPPISVDALVLEQVYPTLHQAIGDRISMRLGAWSRVLTPLLSEQLPLRLGVSHRALRPLDHVGNIRTPKLFVGGGSDLHTTPEELRRMYEAAPEPKQLWLVPQAAHVDLCRFAKTDYEKRILSFFSNHLPGGQ